MATMFILHYLEIEPETLRAASKHAASVNNHAYKCMADQGLISYSRVEDTLGQVAATLAAKFPPDIVTFIRNAKQWRYTDQNTHVCVGPSKKIRLRRGITPKALKTMARLWIAEHRHDIADVMLKACRDCAKVAPLAPDTYYHVSQQLGAANFNDTFTRAIKQVATGTGDMSLAGVIAL